MRLEKNESKEVSVIGWGLREGGDVFLLISDPNNEEGYGGRRRLKIPADTPPCTDDKTSLR
jgi:hypothetical protein